MGYIVTCKRKCKRKGKSKGKCKRKCKSKGKSKRKCKSKSKSKHTKIGHGTRKVMQRGGSGIGSSIWKSIFVGAGPPFGIKAGGDNCTNPNGCSPSFYCDAHADADVKVKGGVTNKQLCNLGVGFLGFD